MLLNYPSKIQNSYVYIWVIDISRSIQQWEKYRSLLSKDEIERANRFYSPVDHDRFILYRGVLRLLLARYLCIKPNEIPFVYNLYGKPSIKFEVNKQGLSFNQSHSSNIGVLAITTFSSIGVDIEYIRDDLPFIEISKGYFSLIEKSELEKLPPFAQNNTFYKIWTEKEAILKAMGVGLSIPLNSFFVNSTQKFGSITFSANDFIGSKKESYTYQSFNILPGYSIALAIERSYYHVQFYKFKDYL
jgi:4'-phosphopantetheinyl transferase